MNFFFLSLLPLVASQSLRDLYVENAPPSPRPYIVPHYADSQAVTVGSQLYRFTVTGPSSDYAFTLMSTNSPSSGSLGVLPHVHRKHYENFFNFKGRFQLWAQQGDEEQQGRLLTQGDHGSVPRNTAHTFQIVDPDTEMVGVVVPGGFEDLFYALGQNFSSATNTPYIPQVGNDSAASGPDPSGISGLEAFDVYAQPDFQPRRDFANGSAPSDEGWHTETNSLGEPGSPYFVANNYGPKYLNSQHGAYQIVQPLVTNRQSQEVNFTMSTLTVSRQRKTTKAPTWSAQGAAAFEVLEGSLMIQIGDYPEARLDAGGVAFIPGHVSYRYWNKGAYAKALYVSSGREGVDQRLIRGGKSWAYPTFPRY